VLDRVSGQLSNGTTAYELIGVTKARPGLARSGRGSPHCQWQTFDG